MRGPSEETKIKRELGTGHGADYKPSIKARDFSSSGTCSNIIDWKHGRTIELLSQGEKWAYYLLRFDDNVVDIREQFPLPLEETNNIAKLKGYRPARKGKERMTTDLLVDYANGKQKAFSIKASNKLSRRTLKKIEIERTYWEGKGVEFEVLYKEDLDIMKANNIAHVVLFYTDKYVRPGNKIDMIRHMIANKQIQPDLSVPLDYERIGKEYGITG